MMFINTNKIKLLSKTIPCSFVAFDIIQHNGTSTIKEPIEQRKFLMNEIKQSTGLKIIKQYKPRELEPLIKKLQMEGIVLKPNNSLYLDSWKKFKNLEEQDFKVVGYTKSETKQICAFNLVDEKGNDVGKVPNTKLGQSDENKKWVEEKISAKCLTAIVEYLHMPTGKLRFPVLKELRTK